MKKLVRLLIVALIAGGVATIIVQRERLRQLDKEQLTIQIRDGIQSALKRGEEAAQSTAETVEEALDTAAEKVEDAADAAAEAAEAAADAVEKGIEEHS